MLVNKPEYMQASGISTPPPPPRKYTKKMFENVRKRQTKIEEYEKHQKQENLIWSSGQMQFKSSSYEYKFEMKNFFRSPLGTNWLKNIRKTNATSKPFEKTLEQISSEQSRDVTSAPVISKGREIKIDFLSIRYGSNVLMI